jgi:putative DNA primase/helicase
MPPIADRGDSWDADPYLVGVGNGVLQLHADGAEFRPGRPEDRITKTTAVPYDAAAECPRWLQFLNEVLIAEDGKPDPLLVDFVHRAAGYSMTGVVTEQIFFLLHGLGDNGKSVLLSTLRYVLADYSANAAFSTFEANGRASIPSDLAALDGARLVTASETSEGSRFNEARVKALVHGDRLTARRMYADLFSFDPVSKVWLAVNALPQVRDASLGFWRSVALIPFRATFAEDKVDRNLEASLRREAPGVLRWLVAGAVAWRKRGLRPLPPQVVRATGSYRVDEDAMADFLAARCVLAPTATVKATPFYVAYVQWTAEAGLPEKERLSGKAFGQSMSARFDKRRDSAGYYYSGVGLRPLPPPPPPQTAGVGLV